VTLAVTCPRACARYHTHKHTHTNTHCNRYTMLASSGRTDGRWKGGREGGREGKRERERERERGMETPVAVCMHTWTCVVSGCTRAACACTHTLSHTHTLTHKHRGTYCSKQQEVYLIKRTECTHICLIHTHTHTHTHTHQIQYRDALQKLIKIREQETAQADILKSQCPSTCILLLICILLFIFSRASAFSVFSKHPQKSVPKP
jgi:hypothetical protein